MGYRIHRGRNTISAITNSGLIVTFTPSELGKINATRVLTYIDAKVRVAETEKALADLGVTEFSS